MVMILALCERSGWVVQREKNDRKEVVGLKLVWIVFRIRKYMIFLYYRLENDNTKNVKANLELA